MRQSGRSLLELAVVVAILMLAVSAGAPALRAYTEEAQALGAGRLFKAEFLRARALAVGSGKNHAIRFEPAADGMYFSIYRDGGCDGILSDEIASGKDLRVAGPFQLTTGSSQVRVGINPGVPAIPPEAGPLDPADPIRFGRSNMVSFSPMGTASPGTLYIAGRWIQTAIRVNPNSSRVRLMVYQNRRWSER